MAGKRDKMFGTRSRSRTETRRFKVSKISHALYATCRKVYVEQRERRDAFLNLQTLDDRMLVHIGLNRRDVEWAAKLPLSKNASRELDALACPNLAVA